MGRYIIRRVLWGIATLFIVSAVIFLIFYVLPSADPAVLRAGRNAGPEQIANIRHSLGLDKPIPVQYLRYMRDVFLHFNFGYSYQYNVPVRQLIFNRLPATIWLTVGAVIIWLTVGISVGIISAVKRRSVMDRASIALAVWNSGSVAEAMRTSPLYQTRQAWLRLPVSHRRAPLQTIPRTHRRIADEHCRYPLRRGAVVHARAALG